MTIERENSETADGQPITVTLPSCTWAALVASLAQRPYVEVAEFIGEIVRQSQEQMEAAERPPSDAGAVTADQRVN